MVLSNRTKRLSFIAILLLLSLAVLFVLYQAAVPTRFDIRVGEVVQEDIYSSRSITDHEATDKRARDQAALVPDVMLRSERVSSNSLNQVIAVLDQLGESRQALYAEVPITPAATTSETTEPQGTTQVRRLVPTQEEINTEAEELVLAFREELGFEFSTSQISQLLSHSDSLFETFRAHAITISQEVMSGNHDTLSLQLNIASNVEDVVSVNTFYQDQLTMITPFLSEILEPNMLYDAAATQSQKENVIAQVEANPVLIPAGTLIASSGDVLTEVQLQNMRDLDLITTGQINWRTLISLVALFLLILAMLWLFFRYYEQRQMRTFKDWVVVLSTIVLVIIVSAYVSRISPLLMPVYFLAIVLSTYLGLRTSMVLTSMVILLLYPITSLNSQFFFVAIVSSWAASLIAASQIKTRNYVVLILGTTLCCFTSSVLYSTMSQTSTGQMLQSAGLVTATGALSAILAIGLSPIYELLLSSVSPVKLIQLSEPSNPLLRKLFLEAPGTYQHSMMIANLAETAAERIGADPLLVRVGAYYHDIGKTWNPQMFTENQKGFNPHSLLTTEESVRVIFRHVSYGEELARKNRLPQEIINFIVTHHGTTVLSYFYTQASNEAAAKGLPKPDPAAFTYPGQIPMNRETGLFMLADTTEAAMRSKGITHLDEAEVFIRRLVRAKIDQDQLVESHLSFEDVEEIIQAFLQVYAGQFHERIKYPDANPISEPAK